MELRRLTGRRAALALGLSGLVLSRAEAQTGAALQIAPTLIDLAPGAQAGTLDVSNRGDLATSVQVRGQAWSQLDGQDTLTDTNALLLSPPLFTLQPGATQTIRILVRGTPEPRERSFRILVDQLPPPNAPQGVQFAFRVSLPVFAAATVPVAAELRWTMEFDGPTAVLGVVNAGLRRARVIEVALALPNGRRFAGRGLDANAWVLGGGKRRFGFEDPTRLLRPGTSARLIARLEGGQVDQPFTL